MGFVSVVLLGLVPGQCYLPPVGAPIVEPFDAPACPYCSGHRGVEYDVAAGTAVHAAAPGVVTFSGLVAGTRYVVVLNDDGIAATYGKVASSNEATGDHVSVGQEIARSTARLYFGLRRGDAYLDPEYYLGVSRRRPRLIPSNGARGRPAVLLPPSCPAQIRFRS